ncbi:MULTISPECIES: penicillin-binding protein 2 [unclassified Lentimonas]|uniref:peptidoglycan D,D-transpeptidase FtsI family protein n=1 Tax=unclassified Lentimonas TaxID=2630993 RepID=UPI001326A04E|nr:MULTISPECIES: penicillin-binding protein 2 [unclassified Lentimonas]CAA6678776.1 Cell division protein FtsI [Peptidoglycan synthetase] (EC [Lentimonas sp. CC4]CAA6684379.1 Cell division protein FtsI [Peptidoglycan synthetase] (EC [Lentimonas sp. CC6]CAA6692935.1 Cell division protein FtsI [Peptidoglycan synthetase] (EC [Lentimonas sp. CC19]CAA6695748.1 Cell division protein FtsI [Peptidoglycan synthetase] (EC [Lentimonas sp. CC10]CAA7069579.1 Cell division protein FtsI [Peptidoglycan synthe
MSKAFVSTARAGLVSAAVAFAFCVLIGRLFYLHVWEQKELMKHVEGNRKMVQVVEARRGNVVDNRGNLLATTRTTIDLGVDPQSVRDEDRLKLPELAKLIGKPLADVEQTIDTKTRKGSVHAQEVSLIKWASLAKGLDEDTYEAVRALGIKGVYGNRKYSRTYPSGQLAAHILGYVNYEETPVTGVERFFDYYLRGQDGWRETERDGRRRELAQFRFREVDPTDGLNVELSIDLMVQHIVEKEIARLAQEYDPKSVSIIVSEPSTGAVLAMANYPTYDPNEFYDTKKYPIESQRNRALTDLIEPGSTFKIVPAAAALNEGIVQPEDMFQTGMSRVSYKGRSLKLPGDHHIYETLSMHDIVVKSSNRGVAHLGLMLGENRLHDYAAAFGFGEKTGFDLGGEVSGILHPVKNWDGLTITRLPMGHAVSATPMQVHSSMSVIANKGVLMEPLIAKRVFDFSGNDVVSFSPKAKRRVISTEVAKTVADMLVDVVGNEGTARRASIENYSVAGKTGTTQKIINGKYSRQHHVASFSGFFPADTPALVITVVVDDPQSKGVGYGGSVAAPAFRNIAEACIAYLGIRPVKSDASFLALEHSRYDRSRRISN